MNFRDIDILKRREIASKGGKAAHQKGTAHEWTADEAREAGRKGGRANAWKREDRRQAEAAAASVTAALDDFDDGFYSTAG